MAVLLEQRRPSDPKRIAKLQAERDANAHRMHKRAAQLPQDSVDRRVADHLAHHFTYVPAQETVFTSGRLEPASPGTRSALLERWDNIFKSDEPFTGPHFATFIEQMIRITGGRNEGGYLETRLGIPSTSLTKIDEITFRWHASQLNSGVPGGNAYMEIVSPAGESARIADRIEYGEDLRGEITHRSPSRVRELILDKYYAPTTGEYVDGGHMRKRIPCTDRFDFETDGRRLAKQVLGFVKLATSQKAKRLQPV